MADERPKSAYELAMERLKQRDVERGVVDTPPTEEQRAAITEARNVHAAKVAELEILHRSKIASVYEPDTRALLDAEYRDDIRRLNDELERKITRIRRASEPSSGA
jgi:hypothetical protein